MKHCELCSKELKQREKELKHDFKKRRFCDHHCRAMWLRERSYKGILEKFCVRCGKELEPGLKEEANKFKKRITCKKGQCDYLSPKTHIPCKECGKKTERNYCCDEHKLKYKSEHRKPKPERAKRERLPFYIREEKFNYFTYNQHYSDDGVIY